MTQYITIDPRPRRREYLAKLKTAYRVVLDAMQDFSERRGATGLTSTFDNTPRLESIGPEQGVSLAYIEYEHPVHLVRGNLDLSTTLAGVSFVSIEDGDRYGGVIVAGYGTGNEYGIRLHECDRKRVEDLTHEWPEGVLARISALIGATSPGTAL